MAYVDLNPVRAGLAANPMDSKFTSIQQRLRDFRGSTDSRNRRGVSSWLLPISREQKPTQQSTVIPFGCREYLDLVEQTGRLVRRGKGGLVRGKGGSLLCQLGLSSNQWFALSHDLQTLSLRAIGSLARMRSYAAASGCTWIAGVGRIREVFGIS